MRFLRSRRGVLTAGILLVAVLFLIRPGANRLRARIVSSTSLALGRPVEVASVHVRLLPRPGFDLENFVVMDDPAFGSEPMLRAQEVTAYLRLASLLRGRLEIARLGLTEPSLNVVYIAGGHWNLESLLERTAQIQVAPTGKPKTERRPAFPYIEASHARINFKFGSEKKPYALTDADFALWQDSENSWGVRLRAQPVRTDFNLSDTGLIRLNGSWQRAATLRDTPLDFTVLWERAQLGQLTKLAYGNDLGWRGSLALAAHFTGTPASLSVSTDTSAEDFRRYDVLGGGALRLAARCDAHYSSLENKLSDLTCVAPVGNSVMTLTGNLSATLASPTYDLTLAAQGLPMQSVVAFARHAQHGVPDDLAASGQLDAKLGFHRAAGAAVVLNGGGETSGFHLNSSLNNTDLALNSIPFTLASGGSLHSSPKTRGVPVAKLPPDTLAAVGPFHLALGRPAPVQIRGWISRGGYGVEVQGEAQVQRLLQAAQLVGIPVPRTAAEGTAKVDVQIAGSWSGMALPISTGTAQLHSIRAPVRGLNEPLEIASADLVLLADQVKVQHLAASLPGSSWHGSLQFNRPCAPTSLCTARFDLHADEIATDQLNRLLNPNLPQQPWYHFLSSSASSATPFLLRLEAAGKLTADRVLVRRLVGSRVSASIELKNGKLRVSELRADVLAGRHTGEWKADFTVKPPQYSGSGTLEHVSLGQLAEQMHDGWITGSATAGYRVTTSGLTASELIASATSALQVEASDCSMPHMLLGEGSDPLQIRHLAARLFLHEGKFEIQNGKLETAAAIYQLSGTATLGRILNVKLTREGAPGFNITGTLTAPRVAKFAAAETQAALKR